MEKILVALRIYPGNTKIPSIIFPNDKMKLVTHSLRQLRYALKGYDYKIIIINDGFPENCLESIIGCNKSDLLDIINTEKIGNHATFELQIDKLLEHQEYNYLYFAEDDYLYKGDFVSVNLEMLKSYQYTTGYYHPDYLDLQLHSKRNGADQNLQITTTCSFWTTRSTLLEDHKRLRAYKFLGDIGFWLLLTCSTIEIFFKMINTFLNTKERWITIFIVKALFVKLTRFPVSARKTLVASFPSTCTHAERDYIGLGWTESK